MPFPNHPDKHQGEALITPERSSEYWREQGKRANSELPGAVVLCYSNDLLEYLVAEYDTRQVDGFFGDVHAFEDTGGRVGVAGRFGIGAPTTAMVMEELVAEGVEAFLSIGFAGCLQDHVEMGEFIVPDRAIRDEGTSYHYAEPARDARPTGTLREDVERTLAERGDPYHEGPTWTTDAVYRETVAEVERYASEGVLTVEMEASAVFAVADHRDVEAAATFVVSDYLGTEEWEPKFHQAAEDLQELGDVAREVLANRER